MRICLCVYGKMQFTCYNASFTQLEIWFRFAFLVMSFVTTVGL